ncbi:MAG TPA: TetR family transcriptional regulator [Ktedonobacterales bacterium]|nr:TetR family transcriptional regulator [Ktedonobacterales bacterium]
MATDVSRKLDRRTTLLQAAREVLAEKGYEATKVSDIVARAGAAQGTFYLYFPSKLSLVLAITEDMNRDILATVQAALESAPTLAAGIDAGVAAAFAAMGRYQDLLGIIHGRLAMSELRDECERLFQEEYTFIAAIIRAGQATGEIEAGVDPEIAARLIVGMLEHAADECYIYDSLTPTEAYIAEVARFIRRALGVK